MEFDHVFLRERITTVKGRYIHNNLDVIPALNRFAPDVIVTDGFNPTYLYAFMYAWIKGIPHIPMTDGTYDSEKSLSWVHRAIRRFVYARSANYISASLGGKKLYESYGIPSAKCFKSCLCIDNTAFTPPPEQQKSFDFIFCGRIEEVKNPQFALELSKNVAQKLGRKVSILYVGSGSQEESTKQLAAEYSDLVDTHFHGFAAQQELPKLYQSARIFLFPTLWDPWGVVANEACAAGLPVIVTPNAGAADELVIDGQNGYVCDLDLEKWSEHAIALLTQPDLYRRFSERGLAMVKEFTFDHAAKGLVDACVDALEEKAPKGSSVRSHS
jgi:glycosyltransferase involved in cell wall biosynthesis